MMRYSKYTLITFNGLPKISLNDWYSGTHWRDRKDLKDIYTLLVFDVVKRKFKPKRYRVSYSFFFRIRPLDATNCIAMVKMLEDCIFQDDKWSLIDIGEITSRKADEDYVTIKIEEL